MADGTAKKTKQSSDLGEYLASVWGVLSFGLILVPLFMMLLFDSVNETLQPVASIKVGGPIALICLFVIAFYVYTLRHALFKYTNTLSFAQEGKRSLAEWALVFFVLAILLAFVLAFGVTTKDQLVDQPYKDTRGLFPDGSLWHMLLKLFLTGCLVFFFVFLSLSASLMAAYKWGHTVDMSGPGAPIYLDEERLKEKVLNAVHGELKLDQRPAISEMKRSGGGGISLTLFYEGGLIQQGVRQDKTWLVTADYRGRLIQIDEQEPRQSKVETVQIKPVLDAARTILGLKPEDVLVVSGMKRTDKGDVQLTLRHDSQTWTAKADRWSRLIEIEEQGPTTG